MYNYSGTCDIINIIIIMIGLINFRILRHGYVIMYAKSTIYQIHSEDLFEVPRQQKRKKQTALSTYFLLRLWNRSSK